MNKIKHKAKLINKRIQSHYRQNYKKGTCIGIAFVAIIAGGATVISQLDFFIALSISPLVIGIVLGIMYTNTLHVNFTSHLNPGITYSAKKILRFAIIFYGFRITFQQIINVGLEGFIVSLVMLTSTMLISIWLGSRVFRMDDKTSILSASGSAVCGAAAILATESVIKAEEYKVAIAVSMVVLFGTISMFLYPVLYSTIIEPATGFLHMEPSTFGIYVGGTVHEVAQVIAIPSSIGSDTQAMANSAVIVKMTRVIMIAPMLIVLSLYLSYITKVKADNEDTTNERKMKIVIPWFAVYFIAVAGLNSLIFSYMDTVSVDSANIIKAIIEGINIADQFLLTMAMTALGIETHFSKFKGLGLTPIYLAGSTFIWLVIGGFIVTKSVVSVF